MGAKPDRDRPIEDRLRAWVRQRMEERGLGVTETAKLLEHNQGNLSRILLGTRGISAGLAYRISMALTVPLEQLFHGRPAETYWRPYVPRPAQSPGGASPSRSRPTRRRATGATTEPAAQTEQRTAAREP